MIVKVSRYVVVNVYIFTGKTRRAGNYSPMPLFSHAHAHTHQLRQRR